jgi:hypothetical protein
VTMPNQNKSLTVEIRDGSHDDILNQSVWRYFGIEAVLRTLYFNKLRFTRVSLFEDEWELRRGQRSRAEIDEQDRMIAEDEGVTHLPWPHQELDRHYRNVTFVSSWTKVSPENMVMWLAYSKSYSGVAIESTVGNLSKINTAELDSASVGSIQYCDIDETTHRSRDYRELIFKKRDCFTFEDEVRFAIQPQRNSDFNGNILNTYEINIPADTVLRVISHPKMDEPTFEILQRLVDDLGRGIQVQKPKIAARPIY